MDTSRRDEIRYPSTRWVPAPRKIQQRPKGQTTRQPKAARWWRFGPWNPREPLTIKVSYRGGAECWYEIHARGSIGRFPGHTALHDVMREIHQVD